MPLRIGAPLLGLLLLAGCKKADPPPAVQVQPDAGPATTDDDRVAALVTQLSDKSPSKRQDAVNNLVRLDHAGTLVIPPLLEALKDPAADELGQHFPGELHSTREAAVQALLQLGPKAEKDLATYALKTLQEGLNDPKPAVREHTAYALALMGPKAIPAAPALAKLCAERTKEVREAAYSALEKIGPSVPVEPILALLTNDDPDICRDAAEALSWLKPKDPAALPLLLAALTNTKLAQKNPETAVYVCNTAAVALGGLGEKAKEAIPALVDAVKKADAEELRRTLEPGKGKGRRRVFESGAMQALRRIGKPAVPALVPLLKDKEPAVRWQAAVILGGIGPDAKETVPDLQTALEAERDAFAVVAAAALAYVQIGGDPKNPIAKVIELLGSDEAAIRESAAAVLEAFGRQAAPAVEKLTALLDDDDEMVRAQALETLRAIGPAARKAVPALSKRLSDADAEVRAGAVRALRALGPQAAPAVPELRKALTSEDLSVREGSVEALQAIGPAAKDAVPDLIKILSTKVVNQTHHLPALRALAAIGPDAKSAAPALLRLLDDKDNELRLAVLDTLGSVGAATPEVIARLQLTAQRDSFSTVRAAAIRALGRMGPAAKEAAPTLNAIAEGKGQDLRVWAAAALARIGVEPAANTAVVVDALKNRSPAGRVARLAALDALGLLGPAGKDAVPLLEELLRDRTPISRGEKTQLRQKATEALGYLGSAARPTVPKLADLLNDGDEDVRRTAVDALGRLGPEAAAAADRLRELARSDPALTRVALEALDRIEPGKE
jgi:HEAT repeat protein